MQSAKHAISIIPNALKRNGRASFYAASDSQLYGAWTYFFPTKSILAGALTQIKLSNHPGYRTKNQKTYLEEEKTQQNNKRKKKASVFNAFYEMTGCRLGWARGSPYYYGTLAQPNT